MSENTIFVIGNGPSLNKVNKNLLKDKITISFNQSFHYYNDWGFSTNFYCSADRTAIEKNKNNLLKIISNFEKVFLRKDHAIEFGYNNYNFSNLYLVNYVEKDDNCFSNNVIIGNNITINSDGCNSLVSSLPLLYIFGYRRFVFVGCDARYYSYSDVSQNNFSDDYKKHTIETKNIEFNKFEEDLMQSTYKKYLTSIKKLNKDVTLLSSTEGSFINEFIEYIPLEEICTK